MKEWCLLHPWMTFFITICTIWLIIKNIGSLLGGKKRFMKNIWIKGGSKMTNKDNNRKPVNSGKAKPSYEKKGNFINERGNQNVPPSQTSAPPKPPRQK